MNPVDDVSLARIIATKCYGAEPRIEPLSQLNNAVFRLRFPQGSKILKLAKGLEQESIRKELMLFHLLHQHGIPAPVVEHADADARLVGRPFFIAASAGDQTVADWVGRPGEVAGRLFVEMGSLLARIHGIAFLASGDIRHDGSIAPRNRQEYLVRLHRLAGWLAGQGLLDRGEAELFASLPMPSMEGGALCHTDFHAVQCIVHEERISAVVDWEEAWAGNPAIDLAIVHTYLDSYCPPQLLRGFFEGYTSVRQPPSDYDRAYLPVRMAQALALARVWLGHGRPQLAQAAIVLYRVYCRQWREGFGACRKGT